MYNMNKHANSNETVNILLQHAMGLHWQQVYRERVGSDGHESSRAVGHLQHISHRSRKVFI